MTTTNGRYPRSTVTQIFYYAKPGNGGANKLRLPGITV